MSDLHPAELQNFLEQVSKKKGMLNNFGSPKEVSRVTDALEYKGLYNAIATQDIDIYRYISSHLTHISVNQSNVLNSALITSSYVFCRSDHERNPINQSDATIQEFIGTLVRISLRERILSITRDEIHRESAINEEFISLLHGERGSGKTFFLNYAVTEGTEFLNENKVIWVRVNLVYKSDFEGQIERWVLAQAAKIALRYYDKASEYGGSRSIDVVSHIFEWIDANPDFRASERNELRRAFRLMLSSYARLGGDRRVSEYTCNAEICNEIYRFLRISGWSFIFIIDGFDQLDVSLEQRERFDLIKNDIISFMSMRANFGAAFLIVSRTNTIADLNSYDPFRSISADLRFVIGTPHWKDVIRQRFSAIEGAVLNQIPHDHAVDVGRLKGKLLEFSEAWLNGPDPLEGADEALTANIRAIMQVLYLHFVDFVDEKTGKGYQVIEHMMLNGHRYPVVAYNYVHDGAGGLVSQASMEVRHEARFFPIVTRAPWPTDPSRDDVRPYADILLQLRCIQILIASTDADDQEVLSIGELVDLIHELFGYTKSSIEAATRELISFEFAKIQIVRAHSVDSDQNRIFVLPKAKYFVRRCLFDIAYLNMCSMRTPLPKGVFRSEMVVPDSLGKPRHRLETWIPNKISNALFLFALCLSANAFELENSITYDLSVLSDRQKLVYDDAVKSGLWTLLESHSYRVSSEIIKILLASRGSVLSEADINGIVDSIRALMSRLLQ